VVVIRTGKEDIPSALGPVTGGGMRLEYVHTEGTPSPPFTLDAALPQLEGSTVVLGFPDILFEPSDAVARLLDRLGGEETDILLGLFPHSETRRADVMALEADDRVAAVDPWRAEPCRGVTWGLAAWRAGFSRFLHDWVNELDPASPEAPLLGVGHAINAAIEWGFRVGGVRVSDTPFLDVGTPEALAEAYRRLA
jgi:glucose-1-phosphate thymidylyltransferase